MIVEVLSVVATIGIAAAGSSSSTIFKLSKEEKESFYIVAV